jgi:outer membrane receptor for ferrienterochelin and colicin
MVSKDGGYDFQRTGLDCSSAARDLHFTFDQFNRRQQNRRKCTRQSTTEQQTTKRERIRRINGRLQQVLRYSIAKKQTAVFDSGTDKRGTDASVQTAKAIGLYGLAETVERACVTERDAVRLRLQTDFDRVEWIFDVFAGYTSNLKN